MDFLSPFLSISVAQPGFDEDYFYFPNGESTTGESIGICFSFLAGSSIKWKKLKNQTTENHRNVGNPQKCSDDSTKFMEHTNHPTCLSVQAGLPAASANVSTGARRWFRAMSLPRDATRGVFDRRRRNEKQKMLRKIMENHGKWIKWWFRKSFVFLVNDDLDEGKSLETIR